MPLFLSHVTVKIRELCSVYVVYGAKALLQQGEQRGDSRTRSVKIKIFEFVLKRPYRINITAKIDGLTRSFRCTPSKNPLLFSPTES